MEKRNFQRQARRDLRKHEYTQIGFGDFCEIWQCARKGSSAYGFDICISRFGIAVHGDISSLSFGVGASYGMKFLARKDVDYYMHSKLESEFRDKREVKEDLVKDMLSREFYYVLEDIVCDQSELDSEDEDIGFIVKISEDSENLNEMVGFADKVESGEVEGVDPVSREQLEGLLAAYNEFRDCDFNISEEHAYMVMRDNTDIDMCDGLSITEKDESIMMRLYYVNHAAKQIMKIKTGSHADFRYMWT